MLDDGGSEDREMIGTSTHLLLAVFGGDAELAIPARDLVSERVPIRFDQKILRFEAFSLLPPRW